MKRSIYIALTLIIVAGLSLQAQKTMQPSSPKKEPSGQGKAIAPAAGAAQKSISPSTPTKRQQSRRQGTGAAATGVAAGTAAGAIEGEEQVLDGYVVSLEDVLLGKARQLNADEAEQIFNQGRPLGFMAGETVYLVVNDDYSIASDKLYLHAKADRITVEGEAFNKGGMNFIRASDITSEPAE